ncbi:MAG: dynamin family protein, partial [Spirochaetaceae bacterium]|nr:dynamin family protein [Spirochaetaceae bacterium]
REYNEYLSAKDEKVKERKKASWEQYERMRASGKNIEKLSKEGEKQIETKSVDELSGKLEDFVGATGEYMPFTKSVEIQFALEDLRDIRVVDTPGVNDPVKSREARTEEYLRECDVVFIISTAGQFITKDDLELMDRLSAREGVRELFLVASMADMGIMLESVIKKSRGMLIDALDDLKQKLSAQAVSVLENLKRQHPEIKEQFDQIIDGGEERFFLVSGICDAMLQRYNEKESWSDGMKGVWENLKKQYPDNFDESSGEAGLKLLAGAEPIKKQLKRVRRMKDKIAAEKSAGYRKQQDANIDAFQTGLLAAVNERIEKINASDLSTLKSEKERLEGIISGGSEAVDAKLREHIGGAQRRLKSSLNEYIRRLTSDVDSKADAATDTETWTETEKIKKEGFGAGVARFFGFFTGSNAGYDVRSWTESRTTIRASAVKRDVQRGVAQFCGKLEEMVEEEISEIKDKLPGQIKKTIHEAVGDDAVDPALLNRAVTAMVREYSEGIVWDYPAPVFNYPAAGTLEDGEVYDFLNALDNFMHSLASSSASAVKRLFARIEENKAGKNPAQYIFGDVIKQLDTLTRDLETKTTTLKQLSAVHQALKEIA